MTDDRETSDDRPCYGEQVAIGEIACATAISL